MPTRVSNAPRAIVVHRMGRDDGHRYAERLRAAGVEVHEVREAREVRDADRG